MEYSLDLLSPTKCRARARFDGEEVRSAFDALQGQAGGQGGFEASDLAGGAASVLAGQLLNQVWEEHGLISVSAPQSGDEPPQYGQPWRAALTFEVLPRISLPESLEALSVAVPGPVPSPQAAALRLLELRRRFAVRRAVEEIRPPRNGEVAVLDVVISHEGRRLPGLCRKSWRHLLREDGEKPEIDALLRTLRVGETGHGRMRCPETFPVPRLRGQEADMELTLLHLEEEILPEADEAFAGRLGLSNLQELSTVLMKDVLNRRLLEIRAEGQRRLLAELLAESDFAVPECLEQRLLRASLARAVEDMRRSGFSPEEMTAWSEELREASAENARAEARAMTFLLVLAHREGLEVTGEEADEEIRRYAAAAKKSFEEMRDELWRSGGISDLQERLLADKALEHLYAKAQKVMTEPEHFGHEQGKF